MYVRIENLLNSSDTLRKYEFRVRKQHLTNHALLSKAEKIRSSLDKIMFACGVFIDFEKALLHRVNHTILLSKLNHYGGSLHTCHLDINQ